MKLKNLLGMVISITIITAVAMAADTPLSAVKSTVDAVLDTMRDKSLSTPDKKQERRDRISKLLRERFNYTEMAKRSLARHWKERTPGEKNEFVNIFSELLESSYIGNIEAYTDEKIRYDKEVIKKKGKYAVVSTFVVSENIDIPIDYKLINRKDKWSVYDVIIEGVSFISTFRSQYNKVIMKESFSGLIKKMKKKLEEINNSENSNNTAKS